MNNRKASGTDQECPEPVDETNKSQKGYYYDDSTGYETYDPESEADEATDEGPWLLSNTVNIP